MLKVFIVLAIAVIPFAISYHLEEDNLAGDHNEGKKPVQQSGENITISLDQFDFLKKLGKGAFAKAYLVRKRGGVDNGKLYALKASQITVAYNKEREVLIAMRDKPWAIGLNYAFQKGKWAFLVMDFAPGGDLYARHNKSTLEPHAMRLALSELVVATKRLHNMDIMHGDLGLDNTLIASDGHTLITDFGQSTSFSEDNEDKKDEKREWYRVSIMCEIAFHKPYNRLEVELIDFLRTNMTDAKLSELKNLPYFDGINWDEVAERKNDPPFEPIKLELNVENPLDVTEEFEDDGDYDDVILKYLPKFANYTYVAPELQN